MHLWQNIYLLYKKQYYKYLLFLLYSNYNKYQYEPGSGVKMRIASLAWFMWSSSESEQSSATAGHQSWAQRGDHLHYSQQKSNSDIYWCQHFIITHEAECCKCHTNKVNAFASCVKAFISLKRVRKETFYSENVAKAYFLLINHQ